MNLPPEYSATATHFPRRSLARPHRDCFTCWSNGAGAPARGTGPAADATFAAADGARLIRAHFAPLGASEGPVLIFLEDTGLIEQQSPAIEAAALGRLSASIAHEIRNPVGAMSHAGQLLAESTQPDPRRSPPDRDHSQ